ncbi:MAG: hypothetical protein AAF632_29020 [Bacteroidota bacterium]
MKRIFLALVFLLFVQQLHAQIVEGNKFINGTINLTVLGNGEDAQTVFTLAPTFGYFINDRTAVGGTLFILSQPGTFDEDRDFTIGLAPFARRYFSIVDDSFYFFAEGSVAFSVGNSAIGFGEFSSSESAFSVSLTASPGFAFFPAEHWGLDFTFTAFGLSFFNIGGGGGTTTLFTIGATSFSPSLGFSYYF